MDGALTHVHVHNVYMYVACRYMNGCTGMMDVRAQYEEVIIMSVCMYSSNGCVLGTSNKEAVSRTKMMEWNTKTLQLHVRTCKGMDA